VAGGNQNTATAAKSTLAQQNGGPRMDATAVMMYPAEFPPLQGIAVSHQTPIASVLRQILRGGHGRELWMNPMPQLSPSTTAFGMSRLEL